jgi:hypothetical protein
MRKSKAGDDIEAILEIDQHDDHVGRQELKYLAPVRCFSDIVLLAVPF